MLHSICMKSHVRMKLNVTHGCPNYKHSTKFMKALLFEPQRDKRTGLILADAPKPHYDVKATCPNSLSPTFPLGVKSPTPITTTNAKFPLPTQLVKCPGYARPGGMSMSLFVVLLYLIKSKGEIILFSLSR